MRLAGRTALISGAGGPMGEGVARRFAEEGASLVLTDISGRRLAENAEALRPLLRDGARLSYRRASVLVRAEAAEVVAAGRAEVGEIDILVNVVGGIRGAVEQDFLAMSEADWDSTMELNLKGNFHLIQMLAPGMLARGFGRIVNVSSLAYGGLARQSAYAAAKAGVLALSRTLALEFAPHVTVNTIVPGLIRTSAYDRLSDDLQGRLKADILLGRVGEPVDIAAAAVYLASEDGRFLTGEAIHVTGGVWPSL